MVALCISIVSIICHEIILVLAFMNNEKPMKNILLLWGCNFFGKNFQTGVAIINFWIHSKSGILCGNPINAFSLLPHPMACMRERHIGAHGDLLLKRGKKKATYTSHIGRSYTNSGVPLSTLCCKFAQVLFDLFRHDMRLWKASVWHYLAGIFASKLYWILKIVVQLVIYAYLIFLYWFMIFSRIQHLLNTTICLKT